MSPDVRSADSLIFPASAVRAEAATFCRSFEFSGQTSVKAPQPPEGLELHRSMQVAQALRLGGLEALLFVADARGCPRPMISALLDRMEIRGMDT